MRERDAREERAVAPEEGHHDALRPLPDPGTDRAGRGEPLAVRAERDRRDGAEVPAEDVGARAFRDVPDAPVRVLARRREEGTVRTEGEIGDGRLVAAQSTEAVSGRGEPEPNGVVVARSPEITAVRRERDARGTTGHRQRAHAPARRRPQ